MSTKDKIAGAAAIITFSAVISKILGFIREIVIAAKFGTSVQTDAFVIALTAPEFLRDILAGGALTSAFIPVFSSYLAKEDYKEAGRIYSTVFNLLAAALLVIVVLGMINAERLLSLFAPGFSEETLRISVRLSYIIFPAMFFMGLASYLGGVLNAAKHFFFPSIRQLLLNIAVILCAVYLSPLIGVRSLAVGFVAGGAIQLAAVLLPASRRKFSYYPRMELDHKGIKEMRNIWIPLIAALVLSNANGVVVKMLASTLSKGSVAALYFAFRLKQLPIVIFGVTLSTAIFPFMSWQIAEKKTEEFRRSVTRALKVIFFITFPVCLFMALFRDPIVRVLFERGSFTGSSTATTSSAMLYYLPGAVAVSLNYILIRSYYAMKDTLTPLKIAALSFIIMVASGLLLKSALQHMGLAMANSIADIAAFLALAAFLSLRRGVFRPSEIIKSFIRIAAISALSIIPSFLLYEYTAVAGGTYATAAYLAGALIISAAIMTSFIALFDVEEGRFFLNMVRRRFKR